jgi:peptide/nickel transport system substrate-binding protein
MKANLRSLAAAGELLASLWLSGTAFAQKPGGILRMPSGDSPASMSIHEESTIAALGPMMGVFNNLVMFDQHVKQNSLQSIVPDLATSWSWNEEGTVLTFALRNGVKWHDGKPFTARDVQCTWDMIAGKSIDKLRVNPRKSWYRNLEEVTTNGDYEVSFHLKRPQPAFIALVASGWSPVYPCHVPPRDMRTHPIGTGPFKFVEFTPNERIKVARNPDYWKKDRVPRRNRMDDRPQPLDGGHGFRRWKFRPVWAGHPVAPADEADQEPGASGDLRGGAVEH